ncbi:FAD-dependent oxidoreductase [Megalodesulfovibrio paquesii]
MSALRIIVVGGSAAGPKAASRAKRLNQDAQVTLIQKEPELSMASCGYPYYVSGRFDNRNALICTPTGVVRNPAFFAGAKGVEAVVETEVVSIDRKAKTVLCRHLPSGETTVREYDKLILCTGASPRVPPIPGRELAGVTTLHAMRDADYLRGVRDAGAARRAVIVGGGLIGVEACEALREAGLDVTVVELLPQVLMFLDWEMAKHVENHMQAKGAKVILNNGVAEFQGQDGKLTGVRLNDGTVLPCDVAVVAIGVVPNTALAKGAELEIGQTGGIAVNAYMQTSDPDIYAAGDCVEVMQRLTGKKTLAPYGDLANLEGRVAGENAATGSTAVFPGTIHSGICKVFDFGAGSVGLSERRAREEGFEIITALNASPDKPGFMGAKLLISKMVADANTGRVLGFQCLGPGDVSRQLSAMAMAIGQGATVDDICMADMPYAPPYSLAIDHFMATAHILDNKRRGLMDGLSNVEVHTMLERGETPFLLDARSQDEFEEMRLGKGETLIPLGQLRKRLNELPQDKNAPIVAYCKISMRGYEAQRVLQHLGWTNVKVMEGGLMAWPFALEK